MKQLHKALTMTALISFTLPSLAATPVSGLYASGYGGIVGLPSNVAINNFGDVNYKAGYNAGGLVGIKTGPFHYNLEGTYLYTKPRDYVFNGTTQTASGDKTAVYSAWVNIGYDFKDITSNISPYLDFGIGYAYIQTRLSSITPSVTSFSRNDSQFVYQGKVGSTFNYSENFAFTAGYRYARGITRDAYGKVFQVHLGDLGLIYRFEHL